MSGRKLAALGLAGVVAICLAGCSAAADLVRCSGLPALVDRFSEATAFLPTDPEALQGLLDFVPLFDAVGASALADAAESFVGTLQSAAASGGAGLEEAEQLWSTTVAESLRACGAPEP